MRSDLTFERYNFDLRNPVTNTLKVRCDKHPGHEDEDAVWTHVHTGPPHPKRARSEDLTLEAIRDHLGPYL